MSISFYVLCREQPVVEGSQSKWLKLDKKRGLWTFGGMLVMVRSFDPRDELKLPDPAWADQVVAVVRTEGRLREGTSDGFGDWQFHLANQTRGAIFSDQSGSFSYVWSDREAIERRARELIEHRDVTALTSWLVELRPRTAERSFSMVVALVIPALQDLAGSEDLLLALWEGHGSLGDDARTKVETVVWEARTRMPRLEAATKALAFRRER